MSGQPYRYASDREMYREMYMKDLQDRIDLDEQVYQAVKGYVSNGTLPAVSQIPDTRSTSQKLLDVEKLKQTLIKDLEPLMDPNIASEFIQALVQSPLNIDNKLVIFLAQNSTELIKELSKKYKYGIRGDSNDIYTFVEFINNAYAIINNTKASVKSVMDSGYSKSGTAGMANRQDLEQFLFDLQKAFGQASIARLPHANIQEIENWSEQIRSKIAGLVRFLPTDAEMTIMERALSMSDMPLDADLLTAISHLFGWMKESLPNKQYIISLSNTITKEVMNPVNTGRPANVNIIVKSLEAIFNYLPYIHDIDLPYDIQQIMNALGPAGAPGGPGMGGQPPGPGDGNLGIPGTQIKSTFVPPPTTVNPQFPGGGQTLGGPGGGPDPRRQSFLDALEKRKELPEEFYDDSSSIWTGANTQDFYDQYPGQRPVSPSSSISSYATPDQESKYDYTTGQTIYPQTQRELSRPPIARRPGIIATDEAFSSRRPLGAPPPGLDGVQEEEWVNGLSRQALEEHERYLEQYEPDEVAKLFRVQANLRLFPSRVMVSNPSGADQLSSALTDANIHTGSKRISKSSSNISDKLKTSHPSGADQLSSALTDANIHTGSKRISKSSSNISDKVRIKELQDEIKLTEKEFTTLQTAYDDTPESMTKLRDSLQRQYLQKVGVLEALTDELDQLRGSTGNGLKVRRGRPKGTGFKQNIENHIDTVKGIQPDFRFSKFGKYLIRNDHLMDNKVSIRTGKGLNIAGLPSTTTSHRVINVIKKIIGGALPTFDEMSKLGEDEKKYLHDISKKSNILEKLNIPTPSKDKEEKDFNEFEILRGEIMAGNDNKDMVRKFKGYLLKFSKSGQLPKQQVNEILQDMFDMNL
jgi:hypothetical protein